MKLPNAGQVIVDKEKIIDYLLNEAHPDNGGKATFFQGLGFDREEWSRLSSAFTILAGTTRITKIVESSHGSKYILDGRIEGPAAKQRSSAPSGYWIVTAPLPGLLQRTRILFERKLP